jgi:hypothetical protein
MSDSLLIAIPSARDVGHQWVSRFLEIVIGAHSRAATSVRFFPGYSVDIARDIAAETALREGKSHILFVDNDTLPPADIVQRLLGHGKEIVAALYRERHPPFEWSMGRQEPGQSGPMPVPKAWTFGDLIEVDWSGFGCILIETQVFEKLRRPWFLMTGGRVFDLPDGRVGGSREKGVGEDIFFCLEAKKVGIPTYVDTGALCEHQTSVWIGAGSTSPTFSFPPPPWKLPWDPVPDKDPRKDQ